MIKDFTEKQLMDFDLKVRKEKISYYVLKGSGYLEFLAKVNHYIEVKEWQLQGGIFLYNGIYYQAISKEQK